MINERIIKLKGSENIDTELDREKLVVLGAEFEHVDYKETLTGDGNVDITYTLAPVRVVVKVGDENINLKTNQKRSVAQYRAILHYWNEWQTTEHAGEPNVEFETFYDLLEAYINSNIPAIVEVWKETR